MNSAFVLCAYFAMLLSPCFVATYGDLLSVRWIFALARRRRTHMAESFLVSFQQERYAMALADEAAFFAVQTAEHAVPRPFLVPQRVVPVETPAFLEARQRVAARLAQLTLVHKLRHDTDSAESATPTPAAAAPAAPTHSMHLRPRKPEVVASGNAGHTHLVVRDSATQSSHERVDMTEYASARSGQGPEPVPPRRKSGESDVMEIAA